MDDTGGRRLAAPLEKGAKAARRVLEPLRGPKRRVWRRIHLGIDEERLEIRAVKVTGSNVGDAPMLPELLDQIAPDQEIGTLTADAACDTRKCHDAIADRGANSTVRWPSSQSGSPCPMASPHLAYPSPRPRDEPVRGKGKPGHKPVCAREPV